MTYISELNHVKMIFFCWTVNSQVELNQDVEAHEWGGERRGQWARWANVTTQVWRSPPLSSPPPIFCQTFPRIAHRLNLWSLSSSSLKFSQWQRKLAQCYISRPAIQMAFQPLQNLFSRQPSRAKLRTDFRITRQPWRILGLNLLTHAHDESQWGR